MDWQAIISSAVISTVITVIGSVIVAHISRKTAIGTAKETANREMEKLERTWDRDDVVSSDDEFAEMAALVSKFICYESEAWLVEALSKVAEVRSRESGTLGNILDSLYISIERRQYQETDTVLTCAINEKRRLKQGRNSSAT